MAGPHSIEGAPYSAVVFAEEDGHVGESFVIAVIQPPVVLDKEKNVAIDLCFDSPRMEIRVTHLLSTINKTLVEINVADTEGYGHVHDERVYAAREGVAQFVSLLNRIEDGTFDGKNYNLAIEEA